MTDEEILGITRDGWKSFTGRTIELVDDQVRPDGGDVTVGCVTVTGEWQGNVDQHDRRQHQEPDSRTQSPVDADGHRRRVVNRPDARRRAPRHGLAGLREPAAA